MILDTFAEFIENDRINRFPKIFELFGMCDCFKRTDIGAMYNIYYKSKRRGFYNIEDNSIIILIFTGPNQFREANVKEFLEHCNVNIDENKLIYFMLDNI